MTVVGWGIVNRHGDLLGGCIRSRRSEAIQALVGEEDGWQARWRWWRKRCGCSAVRVVSQVQQGSRAGGQGDD